MTSSEFKRIHQKFCRMAEAQMRSHGKSEDVEFLTDDLNDILDVLEEMKILREQEQINFSEDQIVELFRDWSMFHPQKEYGRYDAFKAGFKIYLEKEWPKTGTAGKDGEKDMSS